MKKLSITLIVFYILAFSTVKSLNIFEFSLIGIGAGLVYDQYFDSSLNSDNVYRNKVDVMSRYQTRSQINLEKHYLDNLPIQQKLSVIETLNNN